MSTPKSADARRAAARKVVDKLLRDLSVPSVLTALSSAAEDRRAKSAGAGEALAAAYWSAISKELEWCGKRIGNMTTPIEATCN
jgi:hypothetical protein